MLEALVTWDFFYSSVYRTPEEVNGFQMHIAGDGVRVRVVVFIVEHHYGLGMRLIAPAWKLGRCHFRMDYLNEKLTTALSGEETDQVSGAGSKEYASCLPW